MDVLTVGCPWRSDPMSVSRIEDFRTLPAAASAAEVLRSGAPRPSPYCLEPKSRRVVFVQPKAGAKLTDAPFYYQAQYQQAERLYLAPYDEVLRQSELLDASFLPVMIYSVGRAGTTLLSRMFQQSPQCVSLSEPDVYTNVQAEGMTGDEAIALLRAATRFYYHAERGAAQDHEPGKTHLVLKFRGMCTELAPLMRVALPEARELFVYRDAEAYVQSSMRAFSYFGSPLWGIRTLHGLVITRPLLTYILKSRYTEACRFFPLAAHYTPRELCRLGPVGLMALSWLSMMHRAWQLAREGAPLAALRYEDLKADPERVAGSLFSYCGLPPSDVPLALQALKADSQRGSIVGRERTSRYELSGRDKRTIRDVLARHPEINSPDYELPAAMRF